MRGGDNTHTFFMGEQLGGGNIYWEGREHRKYLIRGTMGAGTPNNIKRKHLYCRLDGETLPNYAPSCKLELTLLADLPKIQDGAECVNFTL